MELKKREVYKVIVLEPAKSRLEKDQCPSCGKDKKDWNRRTDWRCCSTKCTEKYNKFLVIYGWPDLRMRAFKRDNFTCVKCGVKPLYVRKQLNLKTNKVDYIQTQKPDCGQLVEDHIIPIAIGGEEFDIDNVQTLCIPCNKEKTKQDHKDIAAHRKKVKLYNKGQRFLGK